MAALGEAGVESLLLKGPTLSVWLYDDPAERPYLDCDLLVDPGRADAAAATLERLGFRPSFGPLPHPGMEEPTSQPWRRGRQVVDLHTGLPGATADRAAAWRVLRAGAAVETVGGRAVRVLGEPARLVHVALHAADHGPPMERPLEDLRRAIERVPRPTWEEARAVADAIGASAAFSVGLGLLPQGAALRDEMGVAPARTDASSLGWRDVPVANGLRRLRAAPGAAARAAILRDELLPPPEFMRWWTPLARRSRRGLVVSYPYRWAYLIWGTPKALRALADARNRPTGRASDVSSAMDRGPQSRR